MFDNPEKVFYLKEINGKAVAATHDAALKEINITLNKIKVILNFWAIKNWIKRKSPAFSKDQVLDHMDAAERDYPGKNEVAP